MLCRLVNPLLESVVVRGHFGYIPEFLKDSRRLTILTVKSVGAIGFPSSPYS